MCWYPTGLLLAALLSSLRGMGGLTCLLEGGTEGDGRTSFKAGLLSWTRAGARAGAADQRKTPMRTQTLLDRDSVFLGINWTLRLGISSSGPVSTFSRLQKTIHPHSFS